MFRSVPRTVFVVSYKYYYHPTQFLSNSHSLDQGGQSLGLDNLTVSPVMNGLIYDKIPITLRSVLLRRQSADASGPIILCPPKSQQLCSDRGLSLFFEDFWRFFMLKVLIADDESKVAQLIRYLVDWSAFGMEIIGTASDGLRALDIIKEEKPELVITDIRMPNLNGIELVQKSKEAGLDPFFIIISGFSEFEYAQRAIQLGVEDYLLKPLKKKDLENVLTKVARKHRIDLENREAADSLQSELNKSHQKMKNNLLTDILVKRDPRIRAMSDAELAAEFHFDLSDFLAECIVVQLFTGMAQDQIANGEIYGFVLPKLSEKIESILKPLAIEYVSIIRQNEILILLSHRHGEYRTIIEHLQKLKISLLNYSNIYPSLRTAIGISCPILSLKELEHAYSEACDIIGCRFADPVSFCFECAVLTETAANPSSVLTTVLRKKLTDEIELLNVALFRETFSDITVSLKKQTVGHSQIKECYHGIIDIFLFAIGTFEDFDASAYITRENLLSGYSCIYDFDDLFSWLCDSITDVLVRISEDRKNLENKPIREAKQYINDHFAEPLTLEIVSAVIGFNPAYFSSLFKKSTGQNFMDYLKDVRISNAKSMLQYTKKDLGAIAAAVGYSDIKYFSKLFRAKTNLTPSEFRKLYG